MRRPGLAVITAAAVGGLLGILALTALHSEQRARVAAETLAADRSLRATAAQQSEHQARIAAETLAAEHHARLAAEMLAADRTRELEAMRATSGRQAGHQEEDDASAAERTRAKKLLACSKC